MVGKVESDVISHCHHQSYTIYNILKGHVSVCVIVIPL